MKLLITFFCLSLTLTAHAQSEKNFLFMVGEKIMSYGGFSYIALEEKFIEKEKSLAKCYVDEAQLNFNLKKKDEELMACKGTPAPTQAPEAISASPTP